MPARRRPPRPVREVPPPSGEGHQDHGFDPAATVPTLSAEQIEHLARVGRHWERLLGQHEEWSEELPVRIDLVPAAGAEGRYTEVQFAPGDAPDEVLATREALQPDSGAARVAFRLRRAIVGPPLRSAAINAERMRKLVALPILSSDALSSVAYGPQAILVVLIAAGSGALSHAIPIALAIGVLMIAVGLSYRQTVRAYPNGGGSYTVASDNLGVYAGLFAAAGLMVDYVLTVAVSLAAGIAAITSAIPSLHSATVWMGVVALVLLVAGNVRGAREAGVLFAAPTYLFVLAIFLVVGVGLVDAAGHNFAAKAPPLVHGTEGLSVLLLLRAFSSGATAMTGIEAISNAVPAFQPPAWRNARASLSWMIFLLVTMFAGIVALTHFEGIVPKNSETVLSELARHTVGGGVLYGFVQATTALVLLLAANTAFNGFPRLLYFMARNRHAPALFLRMGDRLAFSNGMLVLAVLSGALFVSFSGDTNALIPLYAVGVFLAFTLSQAGMVVRWLRTHEKGWRVSIGFNAVGCALSAIVLVISAATKFTEGAWVVVVAVPLLVVLFRRIEGYYTDVRSSIALGPPADMPTRMPKHEPTLVPRATSPAPRVPAKGKSGKAGKADAGSEDRGGHEREQRPDQLHHFAIVPVAALDRPSMRALAYAASLGTPVLAVHISPNVEEAKRFEEYWKAWGDHLPLQVVISPYRAIVVPLARYIEALHRQREDITVTVVLPELIPRHAWQRLMHAGVSSRLRRALRNEPRIVVATIPFHIGGE
jgi:amino acid transporter